LYNEESTRDTIRTNTLVFYLNCAKEEAETHLSDLLLLERLHGEVALCLLDLGETGSVVVGRKVLFHTLRQFL
jgi:hypothetical protein